MLVGLQQAALSVQMSNHQGRFHVVLMKQPLRVCDRLSLAARSVFDCGHSWPPTGLPLQASTGQSLAVLSMQLLHGSPYWSGTVGGAGPAGSDELWRPAGFGPSPG